MGNCVKIGRPNGDVEVMEYDYLGRRLSHVDGSGNRTEWAWDRRSEVVFKRHADGSETLIQRDALRKPVTIDDAGRRWKFEYGGLGWLTRHTDPSGAVTELRYDVEGNLTYVRNPRGQVHRQWFDGANQCVACETFEGIRREARFDSRGRCIGLVNPLGKESREYDPRGRLVAVELPDGEAITIAYEANGTISIDNGSCKTLQQFDAMDQIVLDRQGEYEHSIAWRGGKVARIAGNVGLPVTYDRTPVGRVSQMEVGGTRVRLNERDGGDLLTFLGESLVLRRHFGRTGKLELQALARYDRSLPPGPVATQGDPNLLFWVRYEYDAALVLKREIRSDGTLTEYETDASDRVVLKRVTHGKNLVSEERIAYDAAGTPLVVGARYDELTRPVELHGERFEYDAMGRLVKRVTDAGTWTYEWSASENLVRVVAPHHEVQMQYDATGRRRHKKVLRRGEVVSSTSYSWTNHVLLHEVNDLDGSTRTFLREDGEWEPIGHVDVRGGAQVPCFYFNDSIGAPVHAVDARGNVVWDGARSLFGHTVATVSRVDVWTRFPNQEYDPDVELVYNLRRWYEPRLGVFVTPDPALLEGGPNLRDYSPNPMRFIDPMGLTPVGTGNPQSPPNGHAQRPPQPTTADFDRSSTSLLRPGHWATEGGRDPTPGSSCRATQLPPVTCG
jgi:RHS repeat-associated protein